VISGGLLWTCAESYGSIKWWEFLTGWATGGFSRRAQLHFLRPLDRQPFSVNLPMMMMMAQRLRMKAEILYFDQQDSIFYFVIIAKRYFEISKFMLCRLQDISSTNSMTKCQYVWTPDQLLVSNNWKRRRSFSFLDNEQKLDKFLKHIVTNGVFSSKTHYNILYHLQGNVRCNSLCNFRFWRDYTTECPDNWCLSQVESCGPLENQRPMVSGNSNAVR
jgi:hypothetical protein